MRVNAFMLTITVTVTVTVAAKRKNQRELEHKQFAARISKSASDHYRQKNELLYQNMSGLSGLEYYSQPRDTYLERRVRNGYLPPKPEWSDEKKKAWDKYQAMLGRYPGNDRVVNHG